MDSHSSLQNFSGVITFRSSDLSGPGRCWSSYAPTVQIVWSFSHCFSIGICAYIFSSCSSFIVVDFGFCGNKVFKVNTEVCCPFAAVILCCLDTDLLRVQRCLSFTFSFQCCLQWSLAMLSVHNYNQKDSLFLKHQTIGLLRLQTLLLNVPGLLICSFWKSDKSFTERLF